MINIVLSSKILSLTLIFLSKSIFPNTTNTYNLKILFKFTNNHLILLMVMNNHLLKKNRKPSPSFWKKILIKKLIWLKEKEINLTPLSVKVYPIFLKVPNVLKLPMLLFLPTNAWIWKDGSVPTIEIKLLFN